MDMNDKRQSERRNCQEDVYLEITSLNEEGDYVDQVIACETVDMSSTGLKLYVNEAIVSGTVLDLCVNYKSANRKFFLTAEVKWVTPLADEGWYFVGFELYEADNTDIQAWADWVKTLILKQQRNSTI